MRFYEFNILRESQILEEGKSGKNTHLEHLEDLVFNEGYDGAKKALNYADNIRRMLMPEAGGAGNTKTTIKFDGSPAIICGIDPADGKFFVGHKSVFNKKPKISKSDSDIDKLYGDQPGLAKKLKTALKYLPSLGIGGILQGDFMFDEEIKEIKEIHGKMVVSFKPNYLVYTADLDSDIGKRIQRAKLGMVFHTRYVGSSFEEMKAEYISSVSGLNQTPDVWVGEASFKDLSGLATLTHEENTRILHRINMINSAIKKTTKQKFSKVMSVKELSKRFKPYVNELIKSKARSLGDPWSFLKDFIDYYSLEVEVGIYKLKSGPEGKAAEKARARRIEAIEFVEDNINTILAIISIYKNIAELKGLLLKKLQKVEGMGIFRKTDTGYEVTNPEGFVIIGQEGFEAYKLVDRFEFSKGNFDAEKSWKND